MSEKYMLNALQHISWILMKNKNYDTITKSLEDYLYSIVVVFPPLTCLYNPKYKLWMYRQINHCIITPAI